MPKTLDIIENQIHVGDVKTITYNGGANIRYIELLFCPITKAQWIGYNKLDKFFKVM